MLLDYEDFLRQRKLRAWAKGDPEALAVRAVGREGNPTAPPDRPDQADAALYAGWLNHADAAVVANTLVCLIHQTNYLLDQQIGALERDFVQEGGYSEQLAVARIAERRRVGVPRGARADLVRARNQGKAFAGIMNRPPEERPTTEAMQEEIGASRGLEETREQRRPGNSDRTKEQGLDG